MRIIFNEFCQGIQLTQRNSTAYILCGCDFAAQNNVTELSSGAFSSYAVYDIIDFCAGNLAMHFLEQSVCSRCQELFCRWAIDIRRLKTQIDLLVKCLGVYCLRFFGTKVQGKNCFYFCCSSLLSYIGIPMEARKKYSYLPRMEILLEMFLH